MKKTTTTHIFQLVILTIAAFIVGSWTACKKDNVKAPCDEIEATCSKLISAPATITRPQHKAILLKQTALIDSSMLVNLQFKIMIIGSHPTPTFFYTSGAVIPDSDIEYQNNITLKNYQYQTITSYVQDNSFPPTNTLLIGGQQGTTTPIPSNTILHYNTRTRQLNQTPESLSEARTAHTATYLYNSQKILIAGGSNGGSSEIYTPNNQSITPAASLPKPRYHHTATYFTDFTAGEYVLLFGGSNTTDIIASSSLTSLEYSVDSDIFVEKTNDQARIQHTATWLSNQFYKNLTPASQLNLEEPTTSQRILIAGGKNADNTTLATAQFYDINGRFFEQIDSKLQVPRHNHTTTLIHNTGGKVLLIGGNNGKNSLNSIEIYDPEKNTFELFDCELTHPRHGHSATYIPAHNQIFIFGGMNGETFVKETEILYLERTECW